MGFLGSLRPGAPFWIALILPVLALAFALRSEKSDVVSARARRRAARGAVAMQRAAMKRAVERNDPARYFAVARAALQTQLGERWHLAPDDVTAAEVERRLGEAGAPVAAALRTAEHLLYAGVVPEIGSLPAYDEAIEQQLDQLEA